jgi:hypothetical protein
LQDDGFVTRFNARGDQLLFSTFLGGMDGDRPIGLAVDGSGVATVTGFTNSDDFPTTPGSLQPSHKNPSSWWRGFVSRLEPTGSRLLYSTYLSGSRSEQLYDISGHANGSVAVFGYAQSSDFPVTKGAFQTSLKGTNDLLLAKLDLLPTGVTRYGESTPGRRGQSWIGVDRLPVAGDQSFQLVGSNAPASASGLLLLGNGQDLTGTLLLGLRLHLDLSRFVALVPATTDGRGWAQVPLPLPAGTARARFYNQLVWLETGQCPPTPLLTSSNALEVVVQ